MKKQLASIQRSIWLDQHLTPQSPQYNIGGYAHIKGFVEQELLQAALRAVVDAHDIFSFSFFETEGLPVYKTATREQLKFSCISGLSEAEAKERIKANFLLPFDLQNEEALFEFWLLEINPQSFIWYAKFHHIIGDGFSFNLLFNETQKAYQAKLAVSDAQPASLFSGNYQAFIADEQHSLNSAKYLADKSYWVQKFSQPVSLIFSRSEVGNKNFSRQFRLLNEPYRRLLDFCAKEKISALHFFIASWALVLAKFYRREVIHLSTPVANRSNANARSTFGPFIQLLLLQVEINDDLTVLDLCRVVKRTLSDSYRHRSFRLTDLLREVSVLPSRPYDTRISYEKFNYTQTFGEYEAQIVALSNESEDDPVSIHIMDHGNGSLEFRLDFNSAYLSSAEAAQLTTSYQYVLDRFLLQESTKCERLTISSPVQREAALRLSQGPEVVYSATTFVEAWEESLRKFPEQVALSFQDQSYSYAEVDTVANYLVRTLVDIGVKHGDRIGLMLSRSEKMLPSILALFKVGAVYVPIDNSYPATRKKFIAEDSELKLILVDANSTSFDSEREFNIEFVNPVVIDTGTELLVNIEPGDLAYIIYTSGSTGTPKGVLIQHSALVDYAQTFAAYFELKREDSIAQQSSLSFDTSVEELFPILTVGGRLVIVETPKDFHQLFTVCENNKVTILSTNPFALQYLNQHVDKYALSLRVVISGGDVIRANQIDRLLEKFSVFNTYGPTESTVCATYHPIQQLESSIPIGKPIANRNIYVLAEDNLQPPGALGEIGIGGQGLAVSYLNQADLTAAAFVTVNGERIYRTGDLGKWDHQGRLLFAGRKDQQLSYRGYRIEAGEIETQIKALNARITDCLVTIRLVNDAPVLVAYLISDEPESAAFSYGSALRKHLPAFMIPTYFMRLASFPTTPNGKMDAKALPLPVQGEKKQQKTLASTPEELIVANIWGQLLQTQELDVQTSFFELGGHSLLANQYISILRDEQGQDITLKAFYENPTIREQADLLLTNTEHFAPKITVAPELDYYPLSFPQERLWFLNQLDDSNKAYYVPRGIRMTGTLDRELLERSFTEVVRKHEILRTSFIEIDGLPYQRINPPDYFNIPLHDYESLEPEEQQAAIDNFIAAEGQRLFNLETGPLLRVTLLKKSSQEHIFVFCQHHLIHDGWTQGVLLREFIRTYTQLSRKSDYQLPANKFQFKDFAYWQKAYLSGEILEQHKKFWQAKLKGASQILPLPTIAPRPKRLTGAGGLLVEVIDPAFAEEIRQFSRKAQVTVFITMLTAFKIVLSKFSNETDLCIGTAAANRRLGVMQTMLGMIINTLALRTQLSRQATLKELLEQIKDTCFEAYAYEDTPFGKVVEWVQPDRDLGLMPIFQYMFSFMNTPSRNLHLPDLELQVLNVHNRTAKFDINVVVVTPMEQAAQEGRTGHDERIIVEWEYNSDIFSVDVMQQMLRLYMRVLRLIINEPELTYEQLGSLTTEEQEQIVLQQKTDAAPLIDTRSVIRRFAEQVKSHPNQAAVVYDDKTFSYQTLDELSDRVATYLINKHQVGAEDIIGIQLERSEWLIATILGVLKTGAAYLPIDINYPQNRIDYMLADCRCRVVIADTLLANIRTTEWSGSFKPVEIRPDQLAYIIYTSGSTGRPKGVMIEHRSLSNFLDAYGLVDRHRCSLTCRYVFDVSVMEIFTSLCSGSTLFVPQQEVVAAPEDYAAYLYQQQVSHCYLHPMHLEQIGAVLGSYDKVYLKKMLIGVEGIKPAAIAWYAAAGVEIVNGYGPTEATICSTFYQVKQLDDIKTANLPIGQALPNYQVYILEPEGVNLQPLGVVGELCISGAGLARGYVNDAAYTAEKFVDHPFAVEERLYRTGDLARWLPDGNLSFVGRKDAQLKLRGYRIEAAEVEQSLLACPSVDQALVAIWSAGPVPALVAYLVTSSPLDKKALQAILKADLPAHMIPNYYVELDAFPLTVNGKIDRAELPAPDQQAGIQNTYEAPRTDEEMQLVAIWQELLQVEKVGIRDNFFDLGGHSLLATRLLNKVRQRFSGAISLRAVFENPTIAGLAEQLSYQDYSPIPRSPQMPSYPLSSSQKRLWILSQDTDGQRAYSIPGVFKLRGQLDKEQLSAAFKVVIQRHESLRTGFVQDDSGEVSQFIIPAEQVRFRVEEAGYIAAEDLDYQAFLAELSFSLDEAPLLRAKLIEVGEQSYVLVIVVHHLIADGWSIEILGRDLMMSYNSLVAGQTRVLPELTIQYKDFVFWQTGREQQLKTQQAYWLTQLGGELPVLDFPTYASRPAFKTYRGASITHAFSGTLTEELEQMATEQNATLFMVLLAAINGLLFRYTGNRDIILGTPVAGRQHPDLEHQIGLYLNTIAVRTPIEPAASFRSLVEVQKSVLLAGYDHQDYPFDQLVNELNPPRDTSRSPLFDVLVVLQNQQDLGLNQEEGLQRLNIEPVRDLDRGLSPFDFTFSFTPDPKGLQLRLEYNTDIYHADQVKQFVQHLEVFLSEVSAQPNLPVVEVPYLDITDLQRLQMLGRGVAQTLNAPTVVHRIREQVRHYPERTALVFEDQQLSYQVLDELSDRVAAYLVAQHQVSTEDVVGIQLERSEWLIVTMLGIMKAGAAYLPIDPNYPQRRIDYMLADCGCLVVIDDALVSEIRSTRWSGSFDPVEIRSDQLAYVIYTSGSTGRPKGVMIEHHSLSNNIEAYGLVGPHRCSLSCRYVFDASVVEIFSTLCSGSTLFVPQQELVMAPEDYATYLHRHQISHCYLHPMHLEQIGTVLGSYDEVYLKKMLIGVEGIKPAAIAWYVKAGVEIVNGYGPTEATICSTFYQVKQLEDIKTANLPIGQALPNYQVYILEPEGVNLQPLGAVGELCVSGAGLARGYVNDAHYTAQKFIDHPFEAGARLYRTGDLARWLLDGNLSFVGRKDTQLKLRGHRIEAAEIEQSLLGYPGVDQALVTIRSVGSIPVLVAYLVTAQALDKKALQAALRADLPAHMIPNYFVELDAFPLTINGKIDRANLPAPDQQSGIQNTYEAPRNDAERRLVAIWQELLQVEKIGIRDSFFDLGGHSLLATRLLNQVRQQFSGALSLRELFEHPTIAGLSEQLNYQDYNPIPRSPEMPSYPLSSSQKRLWILSQDADGHRAYSIPGLFKLSGQLDKEQLTAAFKVVIQRHESLRTGFVQDDSGSVSQFVIPVDKVRFRVEEAGFIAPQNLDYQALLAGLSLSLDEAPLLRALLVEVGEQSHILVVSVHHLVADGWSIELLGRDLMMSYNSLLAGQTPDLSELTIQYKDFVFWQSGRKQQLETQQTYWLSQLAGELPVLDFPTYASRPAIKTYRGASITHSFSSTLIQELEQMAIEQNATLFMVLLAAINGLLFRYTGNRDIILGTPVAGRQHPDLEHQIGLYLNTIAVRTPIAPTASFRSLVEVQKSVLLAGYDHQDYPFDQLVNELNPPRDTSRSPLFDALVVLQNQRDLGLNQEEGLQQLSIEAVREYDRGLSQFDFTFSFTPDPNGLQLRLEYNTDIYHAGQVTQFLQHLEAFLSEVSARPDQSIAAVPYLDTADQQRLQALGKGDAPAMETSTVVDRIKEQVRQFPERMAVVFEDQELSYQALDGLSDQVAAYLITNHQVGPEEVVGIQLEHSEWLIVAMLGILKAGAAYLPIDPNYPQKRIDYMLTDCGCRVVIDNKVLDEIKTTEWSGSFEQLEIRPDQLAYVIYTSGSTGRPKGVMIEHQSLSNFLEAYGLVGPHRCSLTCRFVFDVSVMEIFTALSSGSTLFVPEQEVVMVPEDYAAYLHQHQISHCYLHPMHLEQIGTVLGSYDELYLKKMLIGVEGIKPAAITWYVAAGVEIVNGYGPTEATICSTFYQVKKLEDIKTANLPIGQALSNYQVYILEPGGVHLQPLGAVGELCVSGAGLARGYVNDVAYTAQKFIDHPFEAGARLYRTGDLARWLPDGNLSFVGRKDTQLKLRGHRIEAAEVEQSLLDYPGVDQALVSIRPVSSAPALVAYLTSTVEVEIVELRSYLQTRLPAYMTPSFFVLLEEFPLLLNGKIDRNVLARTELSELVNESYAPPESEAERSLQAIWEAVLGRENISINSNFFEIGGNSIQLIQVRTKIGDTFQRLPKVGQLYAHPTIRSQAHLLKELTPREPVLRNLDLSTVGQLSQAQKRMWLMHQLHGSEQYHIPLALDITGPLEVDDLKKSFAIMVGRHDLLRAVYARAGKQVETVMLPAGSWTMAYHDWTGDQAGDLEDTTTTFFSRPFNLERDFPLRVQLIKVQNGKYQLQIVLHHIAGDGASIQILVRELMTIYEQLRLRQAIPNPTRATYRDFIAHERAKETRQDSANLLAYWKQQLAEVSPLELSSEFQYQRGNDDEASCHSFSVPGAMLDQLSRMNGQQGLTMFMSLLAAFKILLSKLSKQRDICIGTPISMREKIEYASTIGCFLNVLPIRTTCNQSSSLQAYLQEVKRGVLDALEHKDLPFEKMVETLNPDRRMTSSPVFQVMFNMMTSESSAKSSEGLKVEQLSPNWYRSKYQMTMYVQQGDSLNFNIVYKSSLFNADYMQHLEEQLLLIIDKMVTRPDTIIQELDIAAKPTTNTQIEQWDFLQD